MPKKVVNIQNSMPKKVINIQNSMPNNRVYQDLYTEKSVNIQNSSRKLAFIQNSKPNQHNIQYSILFALVKKSV